MLRITIFSYKYIQYFYHFFEEKYIITMILFYIISYLFHQDSISKTQNIFKFC